MTPDIPKTVVVIAYVFLFALNLAIKVQSWQVPVAKSRIGLLEIIVLTVSIPGFVVPIVWVATSHLAFADYDGHLLVCSVGNALALANFVAGPAMMIAMLVVIAFRVGPEERMLLEEFGEEYEAYRNRSYRLIPGLW